MKRFLLLISAIVLFSACSKRIAYLTGNIQGIVLEASTGTPLANCTVTLNQLGLSAITGSDGTFRIVNIEGGTWTIQVSKANYTACSSSITVVPGEEKVIDLFLSAESITGGLICGTIRDSESGKPLSGCNVEIQPSGASTTTESNGFYAFDNLEPGMYGLSVTRINYRDNILNNILIEGGETTTVNLQLEKFDEAELQPEIGPLTVEEITSSSARLTATILDEGSDHVTECGFVYGLSPSDTNIDKGVTVRATKTGEGLFQAVIQGLQPLSRYYAAAYAVYAQGVIYSADQTFITSSQGDVTVPSNVICVALSGDDSNDGSSWANTKRTIKVAMESATQGQEIWVAVGYYSESIQPRDGISIYGGFSGSERSVEERQAGSRSSVNGIWCDTYTQETVVDGFKISDGGGIKLQDYAILRNCEFCNNKFSVITASCMRKSCIIENCNIHDNILESSISGVVMTSGTGVVTLVNCFIQGNDQGPAIFNSGYVKTINCVITNNYAGVRSWGYGAQFINTTFASNRNYALAVNNDVQLYNCIIWNDGISNYQGESISIVQEHCEYVLEADNSSVQFVSPITYNGDWTQADWRLSPGSTCIDSGANVFYAIDEDPYDIDGNPRIANGVIDMGAYEYQH